jgi:hypothetical protein
MEKGAGANARELPKFDFLMGRFMKLRFIGMRGARWVEGIQD